VAGREKLTNEKSICYLQHTPSGCRALSPTRRSSHCDIRFMDFMAHWSARKIGQIEERRPAVRFYFGAIAEITDLESLEQIVAITRDLSVSGCFIKTATPFRQGTEVRVRIRSAGSEVDAIGKVTGNVSPEGMGIEFFEVGPEERAIIEGWVSQQ
jgi:hypothetical protein